MSKTSEIKVNIALDENNVPEKLTWSAADYGTPTEIQYVVEFAAAGTDFAEPVVAASTTNTNVTWNVLEFNGAVVAAGLTPFTEGGLDIRVKATTGTTETQERISNTLTIFVTAFSTDLPTIAVPGNHQGWNPPTAPKLASSGFGETDYEGYIWLDGGYKFLAPDASGAFNWGNTDWGDDGSFSGVLVEQGESDCQSPAGYYRVKADTAALTYSTELTNWGIIGAATPGGWDASTALTYNATTKMWEGIVALTAGEFKFRANDNWNINFGDDGGDGILDYGGGNLSVPSSGNYLIELDLSNPRNYTWSATLQ